MSAEEEEERLYEDRLDGLALARRMDETQELEDRFLEEEDEVIEERDSGKEREPLAKLRVFSNEHFPETEFPLYLGENVLGRDPASCSLPLSARSVSKRHAVISLSVPRDNGHRDDGEMVALLWDLDSMNGTRKGRLRLIPHVRYALGQGDTVVIADLPCQYVLVSEGGARGNMSAPAKTETGRGGRGRLRRIARGCISDSDSEGEISVNREKRAKFFDSPGDSRLSSSTFLTPTSRVVPDSEEESSITPSSSVRLDRSKTSKTPTHVSESDPDMEEEEEEASRHRSGTDPHVDSTPNKGNVEPPSPVGPSKNEADFKIHDSESDTDAEGEGPAGNVPGSAGDKVTSPPDAGRSPGPVARSEEFHLDSDTDVEDEADMASESAPVRDRNAEPPPAAPAAQPLQFHLDSDTDTEDHVEDPSGSSTGPPKTVAVKPQELHYDSDTDAEDTDVEPEPPAAARGLEILSDSGSDTEEDVTPPRAPAAVAPQSGSQKATPSPVPAVAAACQETDSDTDLEESDSAEPRPPAKSGVVPRDFNLDSDTDVEEEGERGSAEHVEAPSSSTPRGSALQEEDLETQAFISTSDPFRRPSIPPPLKPKPLDDSQEDSEDEDLVIAPTQCFVSEGQKSSPAGDPVLDATQLFPLDRYPAEDLEDQSTQAFSFQLGLSLCKADQTTEVVGTSAKVEPSKSSSRDRGQKRGLEVEGEEVSGSFKVPRGRSHRGGKGAGEEVDRGVHDEGKETEPSSPLSRARAPTKHGKKEQQKEGEDAKDLSVQKTERRKQTLALKKEEAEEEDKRDEVQNEEAVSAPSSEEQDVPRTPTGRKGQKRTAPSESPSAAKTPRRSMACSPSPGAGGRSKAVAQAHKVLFTGVTDSAGEAVVARLGGSIATGVNDMTHLVTDKVRRTVKFLCAVARGVPIVTTDWLEKSGRRGSFLSPSEFLVKDAEQEKKFSFCLEQSLCTANTQPLLQGYEIHVTRSVKPEPAQMKDIISSSGARYLPKMPSVLKPQTVVVACAEDASLCTPALSASIPVVSAEFLLTGILQQRADRVAHALSGPGFEPGAKGGAKGKRKK
ncbi:hypothetical protein SKAU_G00224970 [Synaphobranchus kaupii]|uniref:Mediator of DNA damage checkpoint protein 1 n=1 Tax=Synaphobranchus kaupii TaxID=118154 RepID=A0A9Q1IU69_SYNKA|nr:hypothetical protein SKAU_G00224970 [Synaphobranchus kaupii]